MKMKAIDVTVRSLRSSSIECLQNHLRKRCFFHTNEPWPNYARKYSSCGNYRTGHPQLTFINIAGVCKASKHAALSYRKVSFLFVKFTISPSIPTESTCIFSTWCDNVPGYAELVTSLAHLPWILSDSFSVHTVHPNNKRRDEDCSWKDLKIYLAKFKSPIVQFGTISLRKIQRYLSIW